MGTFEYDDFVKRVIDAARVRRPPLWPSAIEHIQESASEMVARKELVMGEDGFWLTAAGQNAEEWIDAVVAKGPHNEIPATEVNAADDTWTSGSLSKQGKRWKELRAFLGNDASTNAAMAAEAELYGTRVGSTKPGVKPGEKQADALPGAVDRANALSPSNPWNPKTKFTPAEAVAEQARLLKTLGTKACASMAAAAGVSVFGVPLKK